MAIYFPNSELHECACESWRITSTFTGDNNVVGGNGNTNWELADDVYGGGNLSSPLLSESNGVFTFNTVGWYLITYQHYCYLAGGYSRWNEMILMVSWNSGSNYDNHSYSVSSIANNHSSASSAGGSASNLILGNSNTRIKFNISVQNNSVVTYGTTNEQMTGFTATLVASENP
jgi:hypothetical protein